MEATMREGSSLLLYNSLMNNWKEEEYIYIIRYR
jgi:hypothetical protein